MFELLITWVQNVFCNSYINMVWLLRVSEANEVPMNSYYTMNSMKDIQTALKP